MGRVVTRIVLALLLVVVLVPILLFGALQTGPGRSVLAGLINRIGSTDAVGVEVAGIQGFVPSRMQVERIAVSDVEGPWLIIDNATLRWRPLALFSSTADIETVSAEQVTVLRPPAADPNAEPQPMTWPPEISLPVAVNIEQLGVDRLVYQPLEAEASVIGSAALGQQDQPWQAELNIEQLNGEDALTFAFGLGEETSCSLRIDALLTAANGGVIANLLALPGTPAMQASLSGQGSLSQWRGDLDVSIDDLVELATQIETRPAAGENRFGLTIDAEGSIDAAMAGAAGPLVATWRSAELTSNIGMDGTIGRSAIKVLADAVTADAAFDPDQDRGTVTASVETLPHAAWQDLLPGIKWQGLATDLTVKDVPQAPMGDIQVVASDLRLDEAGFAVPGAGFLAQFSSDGPLADPATSITYNAELTTENVSYPDAVLAGLLGPEPYLSGEGFIGMDGQLIVSRLTGETQAIQIDGQADLQDWGQNGQAGAAISIDDLAALGLEGIAGALKQDLFVKFAAGQLDVDTSITADQLSTGDDRLNALIGATPKASAHARVDGGNVILDSLMAAGDHIGFSGDGALSQGFLAAGGVLNLDDLSVLDPQLTGSLAADLTVTGEASAPLLLADVQGAGVSAAGRSIDAPVISLEASPASLIGSVGATIEGVPLQGGVEARLEQQKWFVDRLAMDLGGLTLDGVLEGEGALATGQVGISGPDLSALTPLAGAPVAGAIEGQINLLAEGGVQQLAAELQANGLASGDLSINAVSANVDVSDLTNFAGIVGQVSANGVDSGGVQVETASLGFEGDVSALRLSPSARGQAAGQEFSADANLTVGQQSDILSINISQLGAQFAEIPLTLSAPAQIDIAPGSVDVADLRLDLAGGAISADGTLGDAHDLRVVLADIPVSIAEQITGQQGLTGSVDGSLSLTGTRNAPDGVVDIQLADLLLPGGLEPINGSIEAGLSASELQARADLNSAAAIEVQSAVSVGLSSPVEGGLLPGLAPNAGLSGSGTANVDLSQLAALTPASIDRLAGQLELDFSLQGTVDAPDVQGQAFLSEGLIQQHELGFLLTDLTAQVTGNGDRVSLDSLTGNLQQGGQISAAGSVGLDQLPLMPIDADVSLSQSRLLDGDLATVDLRGDIRLSGILNESAILRGAIDISRAEFRVPDALPVNLVEVPVREKGAVDDPDDGAAESSLMADTLALDVAVNAPSQVFVRGRGIDAEMGGELQITGTAAVPDVVGGFELRRGRLSVLSQALTFERGRVGFDGASVDDPTLDFAAGTDVDGTLAQVVVSGTASAPEFGFESDPALPEDEVASLILFGESSASISPFQALQLASALSELTGRGPGVADRVRSGLGLDQLTVSEGATGPTLSAGRYVSERVYVGVDRGLGGGGDSSVSVEVEVNDNITVESDVGARNAGQVGINYRLDY